MQFHSLSPCRVHARQRQGPSYRCQLCDLDRHGCSPMCIWYSHLRGKLAVEYTQDSYQSSPLRPSRFHALVLHIHAATVCGSLEAIDLVLLAVRLDRQAAWQQCIQVGCQVADFEPATLTAEELVPRLRIVVHGEEALSKCLRWLQKEWVRTPAYCLTRQWLLQSHSKSRQLSLQPIPLMIELVSKKATGDMTDTTIQRLVQFTDTTHSICGRYHSSYRLIGANIQASGGGSTALQTIRLFQQSSVWIRAVTIRSTSSGCNIDGLFSTERRPIQSINFESYGDTWAPRWWDLLRGARHLQRVSIGVGFFWGRSPAFVPARALAVALLDHRSPTSVQHVQLSSMLDAGKVQAMLDAMEKDTALATQPTRPGRAHLRSLSLVYSSASTLSPLVQLLQTVGSHLESLSLHLDVRRLTDEELVSILMACPRLRCLCLRDTRLESMLSIVDVYEADLCPFLESFVFDGRVEDATSVVALLAACNDPRRKIHRTLRDLEFSQLSYSQDVLDNMLALLKHNHTLRHVGLDLNRFASAQNQGDLDEMSVRALYLRPVKLPAFIAVAALSALSTRLDQDTCRHVLSFAGGVERRKIVNNRVRKQAPSECSWW